VFHRSLFNLITTSTLGYDYTFWTGLNKLRPITPEANISTDSTPTVHILDLIAAVATL